MKIVGVPLFSSLRALAGRTAQRVFSVKKITRGVIFRKKRDAPFAIALLMVRFYVFFIIVK